MKGLSYEPLSNTSRHIVHIIVENSGAAGGLDKAHRLSCEHVYMSLVEEGEEEKGREGTAGSEVIIQNKGGEKKKESGLTCN